MTTNTYIKEFFTSVQGEGLYVGEMQIFIRFCRCNLNCKYCDTDFLKTKSTKSVTPKDLAKFILHNTIDTISLTGGEPLLEAEFLSEFLPLIKKQKKIYLETNGTLINELSKLIDYIDIISGDIKLQSVTSQKNQFKINDIFFEIAKRKEAFIKMVYDENIKKDEIFSVIKIAKKHNLPLVLQPMMNKNKFASDTKKLIEIFNIFYSQYHNTRLIPQMHKFLKVL